MAHPNKNFKTYMKINLSYLEFLFKGNSYKATLLRRSLLLIADSLILISSLILILYISFDNSFTYYLNFYAWLLPTLIILGIPLYLLSGQYRGLNRFQGSYYIYKSAFINGLLLIIILILSKLFSLNILSIKNLLGLWCLLTLSTSLVRVIIRDALYFILSKSSENRKRVAIYGVGEAGAQLVKTLMQSKKYYIDLLIDDEPNLWGRTLNGIKIYSIEELSVRKNRIDEIYLAIPSLKKNQKLSIITNIKKLGIPVFQIPSLEEITSGQAKIDTLKPIVIEDLLGRESVAPYESLMSKCVKNNVICVTGAGGSIGSEICRQIIQLNASRLILFEQNEPSLYKLDMELKDLLSKEKELDVIPILGNAGDKNLLEKVFIQYSVDIVFHAGAYKHVPLVEANPLQGIENNVFTTLAVCEAAKKAHLKKVILISTDKAVRPTNVMGATKRLAELILLAFSEESKENNTEEITADTNFSIVRFGNVLKSSGSVVPLFLKQIEQGGPLTVTHSEVIRYFMTIQEASQLVLQSSILARGGDVFLLDMGKPVKIIDLAKQMISLSGLTIKDDEHPDGDIEILNTGLRIGEKLFEETLIDSSAELTEHPLIFRAIEYSIPASTLFPKLRNLKVFIDNKDIESSLLLLSELVVEWERSKKYNYIIN